MADHDPLCTDRRKEWLSDREYRIACDCDLIARIRADERNRMTLPEWAQVVADARASAEAEVRERVAREIEAEWEHFKRVTSTDEHYWLGRVYADAARIARGAS
jgi:hypothetical protein